MKTKAGRVALVSFTLMAVAGCDKPDTNHASGTIEFTQTDVASTVPARVERILVDEGATVKTGDTIAVLSQTGLPQDIQQRRSRLAAAESELADLVRGARPEELERARQIGSEYVPRLNWSSALSDAATSLTADTKAS